MYGDNGLLWIWATDGTPHLKILGGTNHGIQGGALLLLIYNMVVDTLICHWLTVVYGEYTGSEGFGRLLKNLVALFYRGGWILAYPLLDRLQEALYILTGIFNMVVLRTNV